MVTIIRIGDRTVTRHCDASIDRPLDRSWRRRPGRPRNRWLDQLRGDNNTLFADLWRRTLSRGHSGENEVTVLGDYALTTTTNNLRSSENTDVEPSVFQLLASTI